MKPHFIGLGAQKSGTSWIYANLEQHPEIYIPIKEIHFFSRDRNFSRGIQWYQDRFANCKEGEISGEFSTSYLYNEKSAERIFQSFPGIKLLVVLRNPIDRAFSNYRNDIMVGEVIKGTHFLDALQDHPEYVAQGFYMEQIERYLQFFPRQQIFIMIYEDIKKDPAQFLKSLFHFLEVDPEFESPLLSERINPSYMPKNQQFEKFLNGVSSSLKKFKQGSLVRFLKRFRIHRIVRRFSREEQHSVPKIDDGTRKELLDTFSDSISRLETFIGRELPEWKN